MLWENAVQNPSPPVQERIVQIDTKVFNQDVLVQKGMKSGAQVGRTDDGDFEAGFQIMFQKRKIKKYSAANNVPQTQNTVIS